MKKLTIIILVIAALIVFFGQLFSSKKRQETSLKTVHKKVHLAWPEVGQAAIGSVKEGLLARSSNDEMFVRLRAWPK